MATRKKKPRSWLTWLGVLVLLTLFAVMALPQFLFPPQPELTEEAYQKLFPYQSRFVDLENGTTIHYVDEQCGSGLSILEFVINFSKSFTQALIHKSIRHRRPDAKSGALIVNGPFCLRKRT